MTDQDYIKAAVELADGFYVTNTGLYQTPMGNKVEHQVYIDALAAQLERQYLAAVAMTQHISYMTEMRRQPIGTDLTAWRTNYIVDSGVLK